ISLAAECRALDDDLVADRGLDDPRRDRVGDRVIPPRLDLRERHTHAGAVDRAVGGDRTDHHRNRIAATPTIDHVGEEECLAVGFGHAPDELPAYERMKLGVLVDRTIDGDEEALASQRFEMLVEIRVAALDVAHARSSVLRSTRSSSRPGSSEDDRLRQATCASGRTSTAPLASTP